MAEEFNNPIISEKHLGYKVSLIDNDNTIFELKHLLNTNPLPELIIYKENYYNFNCFSVIVPRVVFYKKIKYFLSIGE